MMMLPVADDTTDALPASGHRPEGGPTVQRLADQGPLTRGLADMLTEHARSRGRILLVPVTDVEEDGTHEQDSLVEIGPLEREDFTRLLDLVLQVRPTPELVDELFDESRGLPGVATQSARARVASGDLTWTTRGVDATRRARVRGKILPSLVSIPWALLGLFGGEAMVEASARTAELERERRVVVAA